MHELAPELAHRFHNPATRKTRIQRVFLAGVGSILAAAGLYLWGIPALAAVLAPFVPVSWEEQLGAKVVDEIAPPERQCTDETHLAKIDAIMERLTAALPEHPYTLKVAVVDLPIMNALAAPGGYIVLFEGLVTRMDTPEELAGVLAHEIQHIILRHTTRTILQDASTGILIAAVVGDISSAAAYAFHAARTLGRLKYSRTHETEADIEGMQLLIAAKIDPQGMVDFFEKLKKEYGDMPEFLQYVSTHPSSDERIETLRILAQSFREEPVPLLPDDDWSRISDICGPPEDDASED